MAVCECTDVTMVEALRLLVEFLEPHEPDGVVVVKRDIPHLQKLVNHARKALQACAEPDSTTQSATEKSVKESAKKAGAESADIGKLDRVDELKELLQRALNTIANAANDLTVLGRDCPQAMTIALELTKMLAGSAETGGEKAAPEHRQVTVDGLGFVVDEKIAPLVGLINNGAIQTISSCQGDPGIIGEGGSYGHVSLQSKDILPLASGLSELLRDYRDDEVMVDVHFTSKPYITVSFRHEAISIVENAFRLQQNSETTVSPATANTKGTAGTCTADKSVGYSSQNPTFRRSSQNQTVSSGVEGAHEGTTADKSVALAESSLSSPPPISAREFRQKHYVLPSSLDTYLKAEDFAEAYANFRQSPSPMNRGAESVQRDKQNTAD
jgi:hypothetical protein